MSRVHWRMVLSFVLAVSCSGLSEEELLERGESLYRQGEFVEALGFADNAIERFGEGDQAVNLKYKTLLALERNEEALETFQKILKRVGESPDVAIDKVRLLEKLGRKAEALEYALQVDHNSDQVSYFLSSRICRLYLDSGDAENSLKWLAISLERGDWGFEYYLGDSFSRLHGDPRFDEIIEGMKRVAGIGLPAKNFTVSLVSGGEFTLSDYRGEVVLIDFWATWCPPCVAEFPRLGDLHNELGPLGLRIVGISLDSDLEQLDEFLKTREPSWPIACSGNAMEDPVARLYGVESAPRYWVVDREGTVVHSFESGGDHLEEAVRRVVFEKSEADSS